MPTQQGSDRVTGRDESNEKRMNDTTTRSRAPDDSDRRMNLVIYLAEDSLDVAGLAEERGQPSAVRWRRPGCPGRCSARPSPSRVGCRKVDLASTS